MYTVRIWNNDIVIKADHDLFSPTSLDKGTEVMLSQLALKPNDQVLDLGCGTGVVGIAISKVIGEDKVTMVDIDPKAIACAIDNANLNELSGIDIKASNGFSNVSKMDFTLIVTNPPYHADFSVAKHFIEEGKRHLSINGQMVVVVKRLEWYKNKMTTVFGGVKVIEEADYYVLISKKRDDFKKTIKVEKPINKKHLKKMERSQKKRRQ